MQGEMPPSVRNFRLDDPDFRVDQYNTMAVTAARRFVEDWPTQKMGLLFAGGPGTGKTRIAAMIANGVKEKGGRVYWASTSTFLDSLRPDSEYGDPPIEDDALECYGRTGTNCSVIQFKTPDSLAPRRCGFCKGRGFKGWAGDPMANAKQASLLILDDLGTAKPSDFVRERLYILINHRLEQQLPVVVTTNYSLGELAGDDKREGRLDGRTASRLVEMCLAYRIEGPDRRILKATHGGVKNVRT